LTDWGSAYGSGGGSSSGGGGWAGAYGGSSGGTVAHHSGGGGGGGFLGLLENAGSDIGSTITGLPRGIESLGSQAIHTFRPSNLTENVFSKNPTGISPIDAILNSLRDPTKKNFAQDKRGLGGGTVAPFVGQERHIYGSALHGNFHPLYQHPLQPLLDLATVATGGGALAAKGARRACSASASGISRTRSASSRAATSPSLSTRRGRSRAARSSSGSTATRWRTPTRRSSARTRASPASRRSAASARWREPGCRRGYSRRSRRR
jgi:hypothetical protein